MKPQLLLSLALLAIPSGAVAEEPAKEPRPLGVEAAIIFPGNSSIRSWKADRDRGIWIQDRRRNWFYGTFIGTCPSLSFAQAFGVETRGAGRLDRLASIIVRGDSCPLNSFVTSAPPPSKEESEAARKAEEAAQN
ncbi:DUF6491 family protein [Sphingopyxis sp. JAI128]|uniref:DUF6491 family protein n=1 Tax=Sphingopyxis sp. JAI128 TaxID=2723066 RepID=UPI0017920489|nr:DUF6491 family protein [Sphingopyxis sp. JAI128]MBB6425920.1 hypothetical protein [Sphingopyxis sp. JAI128]